MFIQVKGGNGMHISEQWQSEIGALVEGTLGRFDGQLMTVEVFVSDQNSSDKQGDRDKRCLIETRLKGFGPLAVSSFAS